MKVSFEATQVNLALTESQPPESTMIGQKLEVTFYFQTT